MSVNVIRINLNGSHIAAVETDSAKLLRGAKLHPIEGSKRLELSRFRKLNRASPGFDMVVGAYHFSPYGKPGIAAGRQAFRGVVVRFRE